MLIVSVGSGNSNTDRQITIIDIPNRGSHYSHDRFDLCRHFVFLLTKRYRRRRTEGHAATVPDGKRAFLMSLRI